VENPSGKQNEPSILMAIAPWAFALLALASFGDALSKYLKDQVGLVTLILAPLGLAGFAWLAWRENAKKKRDDSDTTA
jgi:hypothetical protein